MNSGTGQVPPSGLELHIHYHRPPGRLRVYRQRLLVDRPWVQVSFQAETPVSEPMVVAGRTVLEPGSPVIWFTFPDRWHDVGRFHLADGTFTGYYANVLTPVVLHLGHHEPLRWRTTDLFLDVWQGSDGTLAVLDEEELAEAEAEGAVDAAMAERAREEARRITREAELERWPPQVAREWTLERVGSRSQSSSTTQAPESRSTST